MDNTIKLYPERKRVCRYSRRGHIWFIPIPEDHLVKRWRYYDFFIVPDDMLGYSILNKKKRWCSSNTSMEAAIKSIDEIITS